MEIWDVVRVVVGLVLLVGGGEVLVRGASSLAIRFGISPLVVGLTVVSAATSAPELAVSVGASLSGQPDLAVGNVVGSNIVNILLILGASALVLPLSARAQLVRLDIPVMVGMSVLLLLLGLGGGISTPEGLLLLLLVSAYVTITVLVSRRAARRSWSGAGTIERSGAPAGRCVRRRRCRTAGPGGRPARDRCQLDRCRVRGQRAGDRPDRGRHRHLATRAGHLDHRRRAGPA